MGLGNLRIGDEWNAIRLIATTQTNPWKSLAELVENSIDAKAKSVSILRVQKGRQFWLEVSDDGEGVPSRAETMKDGNPDPDVEYITTRTCDSIKKRLDDAKRQGVQGQFGIGLLGFWALGNTLKLVTCRSDTKTYYLLMRREEQTYETGKSESERKNAGTDVIIGPLLSTVQYQLTGEKIAQYLGRELRGRIRESGVKIEVGEAVAKRPQKIYPVKPWKFTGDRITEVTRLTTPYGELELELYIAFPPEGEKVFVSIQRRGTLVQQDIQEFEEFQKDPWNLNRLDGVIEYGALNIAPATRYGVAKDDEFEAFVKALREVEHKLRAVIREREKHAEMEGLKDLLRRLQKNFAKAFKDLPEYRWFEGKGPGPVPPEPPPPTPQPKEIGTGPLVLVEISPKLTTIAIHSEKRFRAVPYDVEGKILKEGVEFDWWISGEGPGALEKPLGDEVIFKTSSNEGVATVNVRAKKEEKTAEASATVVIVQQPPPSPPPRGRFPPLEPVKDSIGDWRSKFVRSLGVIQMNEAHKDYLRIRENRKARERYIGRLYAKELVLANFSGEQNERILERLIQFLERVE